MEGTPNTEMRAGTPKRPPTSATCSDPLEGRDASYLTSWKMSYLTNWKMLKIGR